jgi:hypothetical protein
VNVVKNLMMIFTKIKKKVLAIVKNVIAIMSRKKIQIFVKVAKTQILIITFNGDKS